MRIRVRFPFAPALALWLTCHTGQALAAEPLRVFAASSLTDAFRQIGLGFEAAHEGVKLEFNFAGTQLLAAQLAQGAPADVFAAADSAQLAAARGAGRVDSVRVFAHNRIVVITPVKHPRVIGLPDLARPGLRIVVAESAVPAGRLTRQIITAIDSAGAYIPGWGERVRGNIVSEETSVRAVLAKVTLGEADAGFVFVTDTTGTHGSVRALKLPMFASPTASYAIGVVTPGASKDAASFVKEVLGERGQAVLRRYGFAP